MKMQDAIRIAREATGSDPHDMGGLVSDVALALMDAFRSGVHLANSEGAQALNDRDALVEAAASILYMRSEGTIRTTDWAELQAALDTVGRPT